MPSTAFRARGRGRSRRGRHAALRGFGVDQAELVAAPSTRTTQMRGRQRVAGFGLIERGSDHVGRVLLYRRGQPLPFALGLGRGMRFPCRRRAGRSHRAGGAPTARHRRPPPRWPCACGSVSRRRPAGCGSGPFGRPPARWPGAAPRAASRPLSRPRRSPAAPRRTAGTDAGGVERADVGGGPHDGLLDLPLADHCPAAAGDRRVRGLERAAHCLLDSQPGQGVELPERRQRQGRIGQAEVGCPGDGARRTASPAPCRTAWPAACRGRSPPGSAGSRPPRLPGCAAPGRWPLPAPPAGPGGLAAAAAAPPAPGPPAALPGRKRSARPPPGPAGWRPAR